MSQFLLVEQNVLVDCFFDEAHTYISNAVVRELDTKQIHPLKIIFGAHISSLARLS